MNVEAPDKKQIYQVIKSIDKKIRLENPWGKYFKGEINAEVMALILDCNPRELTRILQLAFGKAALRGGNNLAVSDVQVAKKERPKHIGFI